MTTEKAFVGKKEPDDVEPMENDVTLGNVDPNFDIDAAGFDQQVPNFGSFPPYMYPHPALYYPQEYYQYGMPSVWTRQYQEMASAFQSLSEKGYDDVSPTTAAAAAAAASLELPQPLDIPPGMPSIPGMPAFPQFQFFGQQYQDQLGPLSDSEAALQQQMQQFLEQTQQQQEHLNQQQQQIEMQQHAVNALAHQMQHPGMGGMHDPMTAEALAALTAHQEQQFLEAATLAGAGPPPGIDIGKRELYNEFFDLDSSDVMKTADMTSMCHDAMTSVTREVPQKDGVNGEDGSSGLSSPSSVLSGSSGTSMILAESERRKLFGMMHPTHQHDMKVPMMRKPPRMPSANSRGVKHEQHDIGDMGVMNGGLGSMNGTIGSMNGGSMGGGMNGMGGGMEEGCEEDEEGKEFQCEYCNKSFTRSWNYQRHILIHSGRKPHKCQICPKAFVLAAHLKIHMRIHTGEKPYKCNVCGRGFAQLTNLQRHVLTHTGQKPHRCEHCNKGFVSSSDLRRHIRIHTGEKPYQCQECSKAFTTSGNLQSHVLTHTGVKPYSCSICKWRFISSSNLRTHIRTHHQKDPDCSRALNMLGEQQVPEEALDHMASDHLTNDVFLSSAAAIKTVRTR